ncbi:MAG: transporter substrate-binding domain-containing protein [Gammaproteobacteria bacterium]
MLHRGTIEVGVIENFPWAYGEKAHYRGVEVTLIQAWSQQLGIKPVWHSLEREKALIALKNGILDVVIGGLTDDSPWKKEVTLTHCFYEENFYVGLSFHNVLNAKNHPKVAVDSFSFLMPYLQKNHFSPIRAMNPYQTSLPVADSEWRLKENRLVPKEFLTERKHVMAIMNGENLLLTKLEAFLGTATSEIPDLLRKEGNYGNFN